MGFHLESHFVCCPDHGEGAHEEFRTEPMSGRSLYPDGQPRSHLIHHRLVQTFQRIFDQLRVVRVGRHENIISAIRTLTV